MVTRLALLFALVAPLAHADTLTTVRLVRPATVLMPEHIGRLSQDVPGALTREDQAIGFEARVTLYPGRPIRPADIGPAALVERNQPVLLVFSQGALTISTEGRSLGRGAAGDAIRVMNLGSRTTVSGIVQADGSVRVGATGAFR